MTTYRFSRAGSHSFNSSVQVLGYIKFAGLALLAFILDLLNIPSFFGGEFHIFLFEAFLFFYLLFCYNERPKYLAIFLFYIFFDILGLNYIGISFISFAFSFMAVKFLSGRLGFQVARAQPKIMGIVLFILLFLYLFLFVTLKLFFMWALMDFSPSFSLLLFFIKCILYTSLLFINLYLIMPSKQN